MRASDTDRDEVVDRLRRAGGEGRMEPDELDERVRRALVAVTYGELSALVADLPAEGVARRALTPQRRAATWTWQVARTHPGSIVVLIPLVVVVGTVLLTMAVISLLLVAAAMALGAQRRVGPGRRRRHTAASIS
jgi:alkylhydroperoxidase family enzyme